jgi:phosphocarrier protein
MEKFTAKIIDPIGLHARPASKIVQASTSLEDDMQIVYGDKKVNLKSIIAIMSLGVKSGQEITIEISGPTEKKSIEIIKNTMKSEKLI